MKADFDIIVPKSDADWSGLPRLLNGNDNALLKALIERFRSLGCVSILVEKPYIDRDFSAAFAAFYSTLFKPMSKFCRRLHFFASDVSGILAASDSAEVVAGLDGERGNYLGDAVLRPLSHAPVSSARVPATRMLDASKQEVSIKSVYRNHVLGVEFEVDAMPVTQQDTRIGACAQAAMWMAGRHFCNRHAAPWFSIPDITEAALNPTDSGITRSLPAGSEYLTQDNMVRALRAMGRHPVTYVPDSIVNNVLTWQNVRPRDVISRYVDSGIPVIIGMQQAGTSIGHGVVAVGVERTDKIDPSTVPQSPTSGEYLTHILVNDDQRGAYCRLPVAVKDKTPEYPFCLETDVKFLLVPLPEKVFMTAETAELVARDILRKVAAGRHAIAAQALGGTSWDVDPAFYDAYLQGEVFARTYLTFGWKYKGRMLRNAISDILRNELLQTQLPKYVWVTEFSLSAEVEALDPCQRRVRGHVVIDATGSIFWDSALIVDSPGLSLIWHSDPNGSSPSRGLVLSAADTSGAYWPKIRGQENYDTCGVS